MTASSRNPRLAWIYAIVAAAVFGLWWVAAYVALPQLIRSAYDGTSLDFINGLIAGQGYHPVERYLAAGARFARLCTIVLSSAILVLPLLYRFRAALRRLGGKLFRRPPLEDPVELLLAAGSMGVIFGLLEAGLSWIRFQAAGHLTTANNPDSFWMAPLALAALYAVLTGLAVLATASWRAGLSRRLAVVLCGTLGVFGVIRALRLGLHPFAVWALSIAVGIQLGRVLDRRAGAWRALRLAAVPAVALLLLAPVVFTDTIRYRVERETGSAPGGSAPGGSAPNVLLLVLDTVRGESLGLGGYARPTSPNLDRLAREGVVFERAIAPSPWTLPTHATLFTGRYTYQLGVAWDQALPERFPTLAEAMGRLGYVRGGFVANKTNAGRGTGLERGFNRYVDHPRSFGTWITSAFVTRRIAHESWPKLPARWQSVDRKYAPHVNEEVLDWIDGLDGRPFFAFLNYMDAHAPYEGHDAFMNGFEPANRSTIFGDDGLEREAGGRLARDIDAYDSSIALLDHHIGLLLDELEARGLLENTLLIVTSDHGEHLGERGLMDHGNSLYAQLLLVPLIAYWPGHTPPGTRIDAPVSLSDLPVTIVDLASGGLRNAGAVASALPGTSLARRWLGGEDGGSGTAALAEVEAAPHGGFAPGPNTRGDMKSLVDGPFQYILNGDGQEELFELSVDPRGRFDLAETDVGRHQLPRLRALLSEALAEAPAASRSSPRGPAGGGR